MTRIARRLLVVTLGAGTAFAGFTNPSFAAPDDTPPGPVHGITAKAFAHRVLLTWKNPNTPGPAKIVIRRNVGMVAPKTPTSGALVQRVKKPVHRVIDKPLSPSTIYTYAFFTVDAHHNIGHRKVKRVTTAADRTAPRAVTITKVTPTDHSISLSWTLPADPDPLKVTVVRKDDTQPPQNIDDGFKVRLSRQATTYTDTRLVDDAAYAYTVFTTDRAGNTSAVKGSNSRSTATLPDITAPEPVSDLTATTQGTSVILNWVNAVDSQAVGQYVFRALGNTEPVENNELIIAQLPPGATAFADTANDPPLLAHTAYTYWVVTFDEADNRSAPESVNVTTGDNVQPGPVTSLSADPVGPSSIQLSWINPEDSDFAGIEIRRGMFTSFPMVPDEGTHVASLGPDATTVLDEGLEPDTLYAYSVFAFDTSGNYSTVTTFGSTRDPSPNPLH